MTLKRADISDWSRELTEAVRSMDVKIFKRFYKKWMKRGLYVRPLPHNDMVIAIAMRKQCIALAGIPEEEKAMARLWLHERGYNESMYKVGL